MRDKRQRYRRILWRAAGGVIGLLYLTISIPGTTTRLSRVAVERGCQLLAGFAPEYQISLSVMTTRATIYCRAVVLDAAAPLRREPIGSIRRDNSLPKEVNSSSLTLRAQLYLLRLGFDVGPADGLYGLRTKAAIEAWQRSRYVAVEPVVTPELVGRLQLEAATRIVPAEQIPAERLH